MAARLKIIILDRLPDLGSQAFRVAYWVDVPAARQSFYAIPGAVSAWSGAQAADNAAIAAGEVVEVVETFVKPNGTLAQAQADLQINWQRRQDAMANINRYQRYGTTWDGTTWAAGGVS